MMAPLGPAAVATALAAGADESDANDDDSVSVTPEGAIRTPLIIGCARLSPGIWMPASVNTVEPALCDM